MNKYWSIIIAISVVLASFVLGNSLSFMKRNSSKVSVKGLSERNVVADQAWWSIQTQFTANTVEEIQTKTNKSINTIKMFLKKEGFTDEEIKTDNISVYQNNYRDAVSAYNADLKVNVMTSDINKVEQAQANVGRLLEQGILLIGDKWATGPKYFFTQFTDIKPEMIAEATIEAKKAADEFAKNSGSTVGKIANANQGVFTIIPANRINENEEFYKNKIIRVVSSVDFYLD